jgi:hypothetical protein
VEYNGRGFFPLWDTTEEFFFAVGYNGEGFPPFWGTTEKRFFLLWDTTENNLRIANKFFLLYPTTQETFLPLYPTPQQNLMQCTVSQKNLPHCIPQGRGFSSIVSHNGRYFPPLWDTMGEDFFVVGYNGRSFPPLWDTTEEVIFHFGIQRKSFFTLWDTIEKNYTTLNDIFKF